MRWVWASHQSYRWVKSGKGLYGEANSFELVKYLRPDSRAEPDCQTEDPQLSQHLHSGREDACLILGHRATGVIAKAESGVCVTSQGSVWEVLNGFSDPTQRDSISHAKTRLEQTGKCPPAHGQQARDRQILFKGCICSMERFQLYKSVLVTGYFLELTTAAVIYWVSTTRWAVIQVCPTYHLIIPKGKHTLNFTEEKPGVGRGETKEDGRGWLGLYFNLIFPVTKASVTSLSNEMMVNANSGGSKPLLQFVASRKKNTWRRWVEGEAFQEKPIFFFK